MRKLSNRQKDIAATLRRRRKLSPLPLKALARNSEKAAPMKIQKRAKS